MPSSRYVRMESCPVPGCSHFDGKPPATVPGMKRHVIAAHGREVLARIEWPSLYPKPKGAKIAEVLRGEGVSGEEQGSGAAAQGG